MTAVEANPNLGAQIVEDAKEYVLYSWSTQDAINPIAVAGAEGRYFWDYEGTEVTGSPEIVLLRGTVLVEGGELLAEPGVGEFVERAAFGQELLPAATR